ncbi:MAG: ABC transporter permease [Gemmatimonadaceae bacterium]|nr:ABC transporter permease [Gemmatimonadaceae bacterium]NUQ93734.1 ABC transporter permease [Gemmatimonadaceae bacterium]NUS95838.1 ABC transporter permease [Gemmatimonadaceae bacterium]
MSATSGPWSVALRRLRRDRVAIGAAAAIVILALAALLAPLIAPYPPNAQPDIVGMATLPPSGAHPFGTDVFSRDVLTRVMYGGRVSLGVAVLSIALSITIGTAYGAVAGYVGGATEAAMMRLIDALLAVPRVLLLLLALALWGAVGLPALILMLGLTGWFGTSRLVRERVRALSRGEFALAARALGASHARVLWRHVLPSALTPVIVAATLGIGNVVVLEASLSYLGIGVRPPNASWGNIIQEGSEQIASGWWIALFPGLAILVTVVAFNLLGDALRDALDPRK